MVAGGVAPLSATTRAHNDTPLVFLKNNQEMYSSGCATGSTGVGAPGPGLPTEWRLGYACPLQEVPGLRGRSLFRGAPGTVRPAFPLHLSWTGGLGRSSEQSCAVCEHPGFQSRVS